MHHITPQVFFPWQPFAAARNGRGPHVCFDTCAQSAYLPEAETPKNTKPLMMTDGKVCMILCCRRIDALDGIDGIDE